MYVFVTTEEPNSKIGFHESPDMKLLSKTELDKLSPDEVFGDTITIYDFIFDQILDTWQPVDPSEFIL